MNRRQLRARVVLDEARALGLDLADLVAADTIGVELPTVAAYLDEIGPTFTPATAATYRPYWRLTSAQLGSRRLADITVVDLSAIVDYAAARAVHNRSGSTGRASRETCVSALRALFGRAVASGLITANPAAALVKPRRVRSRRRALDDGELAQLLDAVRTTSNDPELDLLMIRYHLESGARRAGALNLRLRDLDRSRATVWLREKGDSEREQPVSPSLLALLEHHGATRGCEYPDDPVLRNRHGVPSQRAATTPSSSVRAPASHGPIALPCRRTSSATPRSPPSVVSPATPSPKPSPATPRPRSPAATFTQPLPRSPRQSPSSRAHSTRSPGPRSVRPIPRPSRGPGR